MRPYGRLGKRGRQGDGWGLDDVGVDVGVAVDVVDA